MCNLYLLYLLESNFFSIFNLYLMIQYKAKTFLDFINDDSIKDQNEKINNNSIGNKNNDNNEKIKINNKSIHNKNNIYNEKIEINNNSIDKKNNANNEKNKINNNSIENINDNQKSLLIQKQNEYYEKKVKELENKIKKLELIIKEKDNIIDNKIKELENISNNNIEKTNKIKELEKEIEKYKKYCLLPGEKLINIKFISIDQTIDFIIVAKNTDNFAKLETSLYEKYPNYKDTENYFLVNGKKLNRHRTLEENKIKDNDILTLGVIDE